MKNLKLALKLAVGFGLVILLALLLGGFSVWQMSTATLQATVLASEKVPAVGLANGVERAAMLTMYEIRGFGLTGEDAYHTAGLKNLAEVKSQLKAAKELAEKYTGLEQLKRAAEKAEARTLEYEQLVKDTYANDKLIEGNRQQMDLFAKAFIKVSNEFIDYEVKAFDADTKAGAAMEKVRQGNGKIITASEVTD
ncbi:MAG: hypothetical protein WCQ89_18210, partial [Verrucomicrobiota bacterium]